MLSPLQALMLRLLCAMVVVQATAAAQCQRLPDGTWRCPPAEQAAEPTAMDVRIECLTARGSGTAVARLADGGTLVVTNYHVIHQQPSVLLHAGNGQTQTGKVVAVDQANDLAAIAIRDAWPFVNLGGEVTVGMPVQFRAFDAGVRFRKYFGHVRHVYQQAHGAGGFFASGQSVPGNSGGGVYRHGRLVGVVWGNPNGGTAFVRIGPVRRLIQRACNVTSPQRAEAAPRAMPPANVPDTMPLDREDSNPSDIGGSPVPVPCDCDHRWVQLEQTLAGLQARIANEPPAENRFGWMQMVAAAIGVSTPIGVAMVAAGMLLRVRNQHRGQDSEVSPNGSLRAQPPAPTPSDIPAPNRSDEKHRYAWHQREQRAVPVAIDSPPAMPEVVETNRYVPYETSHFQNAYAWASGQVARKFPTSVETLNTLDSLIKQQVNGL